MKRFDPKVDVVIVGVQGGHIYARKILDTGRRGPRAMIGTVEEFGYQPDLGETLSIPDDIEGADWL